MQPPESEQQTDDAQHDEAPQEMEALSLEQQLADARQQRQECFDALLRSQADFLNYKRRALQDQAEARVAAQQELLEKLLPALDDLGRALEAAPAELAEQPWVQGLHLVARHLAMTLQQLGVRQIGSPGEAFDPHRHEAVMTERRADLPEGTVIEVTRPGYALGDRVLRPSQVIVAAAPETTAVAPTDG
ncbi:MAG TPA: nucleotide exchange factor GrpE [Ktedonobacterales bacterium]|nr:nucleotide exchange factor GrpE [Ktedonobacterales bacterium]